MVSCKIQLDSSTTLSIILLPTTRGRLPASLPPRVAAELKDAQSYLFSYVSGAFHGSWAFPIDLPPTLALRGSHRLPVLSPRLPEHILLRHLLALTQLIDLPRLWPIAGQTLEPLREIAGAHRAVLRQGNGASLSRERAPVQKIRCQNAKKLLSALGENERALGGVFRAAARFACGLALGLLLARRLPPARLLLVTFLWPSSG